MFGNKKRWIYVSLGALFVSLSFFATRVFAATPVEGYVSSLVSDHLFSTTPTNVKSIVQSYCEAVLSSSGFYQNSFVYNAKYSSFVYLLCKNDRSPSSLSAKYFKLSTYAAIGMSEVQQDYDVCVGLGNDCNIPAVTSQLFTNIVSDYVNMKQANLYGVVGVFTGEADMENQINIFSDNHFGLSLCDPTQRYPSTCRVMKGYLKNARNLFADVRLFDTTQILGDVQPLLQKTSQLCLLTGDSYNIFLCGLFGDTQAGMVSFVNLAYNELFYYRLFMGYYFMMLQKNPSILIHNTYHTNISSLMQEASNQYLRSKDALSLTLRMMRDTYMAYPFHLGFLMYQEDLDGFGQLLSRVRVPIYTLSSKLKNVQQPK